MLGEQPGAIRSASRRSSSSRITFSCRNSNSVTRRPRQRSAARMRAQLQDGTLAEGMRDHLGAPAFLAEQALEQVGGEKIPESCPPSHQRCECNYGREGTQKTLPMDGGTFSKA
jgi:hypothetical protein